MEGLLENAAALSKSNCDKDFGPIDSDHIYFSVNYLMMIY